MLALETLQFKSETKELKDALDIIKTLSEAMEGLGKAQGKSSKGFKDAAKAVEDKQKADDKAAKTAEKSASSTDKQTEALDKQTKAEERAAKASSAAEAILAKKQTVLKILSGQTVDLVDSTVQLDRAFTQSQAAQLASLKTIGATGQQYKDLAAVMQDINSIIGVNPFDKSSGSLEKLRKETSELKLVNELLARGLGLTKDQVVGLARDMNALSLVAKEVGASDAELTKRKEALIAETVKEAGALNTLIAASKDAEQKAKAHAAAEYERMKAVQDSFEAMSKNSSKNLGLVQTGQKEQYNADMQALRDYYSQQEALDAIGVAARKDSFNEMVKVHEWKQQQDKQNYNQDMQALREYYSEMEKESQMAAKELQAIANRIAKEQATAKYISGGASRSTANVAAGMEVRGVSQETINSFLQEANAKEKAAKAARETAAANQFLADTEAKLNAALDVTNASLNRQSSDELVKIKTALMKSGLSAEQAAAKYEILEEKLRTVSSQETSKNLQHLARAVSVQLGDVGVSLASGMNPFMVMIQQGDQIRGAVQQAGASTQDMQKVMSTALMQIATSFMQVGTIMSSFFVGSIKSVSTALTDMVMKVSGTGVALDKLRSYLVASQGESSKFVKAFDAAGLAIRGVTAVSVGLAAVLGGVVLAALIQTQTAMTELNKNLISSGANLGLTKDQVYQMAMSMDGASGSAIKFIEAFSQVASTGKISADVMKSVASAAINLEKAGGRNTEESIKMIAKAYDDPIKALSEYRMATGLVTAEEMNRVISLVDMGEKIKAVDEAQTLLAKGTEEEAKRMKAGLTPVEELWALFKDTVGSAWEEVVKFSNSSVVLGTLKTVFQTIAVLVTEVYYGIRSMAESIGGLGAIASAALTDITNVDTNFTESKKMLGFISEQDKARKDAYNNAVDRIMQQGKYERNEIEKTTQAQVKAAKQNSDMEAARLARSKAMDDVNKFEEKTAKDRMTREQYINKVLEDRLKISKDLTNSDKDRIRAMAGTEWDQAQKKPKKTDADKERDRLAKAYIKDLEKINEIYTDGIAYQENYSQAQKKILDIISSPNFSKYSVEQRKQIALNAEQAIAQADVAEGQKLMNSLLAQSSGLGSNYYEQLRKIEAAYRDGGFSGEDFELAKERLYAATEQGKQYIAFLDRLRIEEQKQADNRKALEAERSSTYMTSSQAEILKAEQDFNNKRLAAQRDYLARVAEIQRSTVGTDPAKLQELMQKEAANLQSALDNINFDEQTSKLKNFSDGFRGLIEQLAMLKPALEGVFGNFGSNLGTALDAFTNFAANLEKNARGMEAALKSVADAEEALSKARNSDEREAAMAKQKKAQVDLSNIQKKSFSDELSGYTAVASAAKNMFGKKTAAAKAFGAIEKVLHVARIGYMLIENAQAIKSVAVTLAADGAKQASALATMAIDGVAAVVKTLASIPFPFNVAAGAAVAAIVAGLIGSVGGSFSGGGSMSAPSYNTGTGTVFGNSSAKSESLGNSAELLKEANQLTQKYSPQMVMYLRSIDSNIGGLVNLMIRTGNLSAGSKKITTGSKINGLGGPIADIAGSVLKVLPLMTGVGNIVNKLIGAVFGSTKTTVTGTGITGGAQSLQDIMQNQFQAQYFTDVKVKKSGLFGSSTKYKTYLSEADAELEQQITAVFTGVYNAVLSGAKALGKGEEEIVSILNNFVVDIGKVNLTGTAEEMQQTLSAAFSAASDSIAKAAFPGLEQFQKVGEGYFETLVRMANQMEVINSTLDMFNARLLELNSVGIAASQALVDVFGGLNEFQSSVSNYYDNFYSEEEKNATRVRQLTKAFEGMNLELPSSITAYRDLVNAQDLTTEKGRETFYALIQLSSAFKDVQDAATSMLSNLRSATDSAMQVARDAANSLISSLSQTFSNTDEAYSALERSISAQKTALSQMNEQSLAIISAQVDGARNLESALRDVFDTLSGAVKDLRNEATATAAMQLKDAMSIISSGNFMNPAFADAVNTAKSGVMSGQYATSVDRDRAFITLSNKLEALKVSAGIQLTDAERTLNSLEGSRAIQQGSYNVQVKSLDEQLSNFKTQIEILRGNDTSLKSINDLTKKLQTAIDAERQAREQIDEIKKQMELLESQYEALRGIDTSIQAFQAAMVAATSAIAEELASMTVQVNMNNTQYEANGNLVPTFAEGGSYSGGLALVGETGAELINFNRPGMVYNSSQTSDILNSGSPELMKELITEVQMLRAEVRADVVHNSKTAKLLDRVASDGRAFNVTAI